jgi:predicted DsbA family dithiol-disulfide isomerase
VRVDIWSDVVCPWCWLGKRRFERAVAGLDWAGELDVRWRAFQLDPRAPTEPEDLREVLQRKYGPAGVAAMTERLTAAGAAEGLEYRWDRMQRVNTLDAHRLLAWAGDTAGSAAQDRLEESLFQAYFQEGENVADRATLARRAADAGLDADEAAAVLDGDAYHDRVRADQEEAVALGLTGVPAFVIDGRWAIPGAQDSETVRLVLERSRRRLAEESAAVAAGDSCTVDDPHC